jgi:hypothetical protein
MAWKDAGQVKLSALCEQSGPGVGELPLALFGAPFSSLAPKITGRLWKARIF